MSEQPLQQVEYVLPDGTLTDAGWLLLADIERRLTVAEAAIADHEARIAALESP